MSKTRHISIVFIVSLLILTLTASEIALASSGGELVDRSLRLLKRLQYLESRHENVTRLVDEVNMAVQLAQQGNASMAERILDSVEADVSKLEASVAAHYNVYITVKASEVAVILSIPVLFYYGFPRLYLYIWFRLRRRWYVKDGSTGR